MAKNRRVESRHGKLLFLLHTGTRSSLYKLYVAPAKKLVLSTYFMQRVVLIWNSLHGLCFVLDTLNAFQAKVRNINFNRFLNGRV